MPTSLVTGGAGFLGSHLVDALAKRGDAVVVLDDLKTGSLGNLSDAISSGRITFIYAESSADSGALREVVRSTGTKKVDFIFHCASGERQNAGMSPQWTFMAEHDRETVALIDLAVEYRSRLTVYRLEPAVPASPHGSVDIAEVAVSAAARERDLDARFVRLSGCYGPRVRASDDGFIAAMLAAAMQGLPLPIDEHGAQTHDLMYVADAVDHLLAAATGPRVPLGPAAVFSGNSWSAAEIALAFSRAAKTIAQRSGGPARSGTSATRPTPLDAGLQKTCAWYADESAYFV